jgi:Trk K+ transport system NAD-binding subunit
MSHAYSLGMGFGELWEINIDDNSTLAGSRISDLKLPKSSRVYAIYRKDEGIIYAASNDVIRVGDNLIFFAASPAIKGAEKIFA